MQGSVVWCCVFLCCCVVVCCFVLSCVVSCWVALCCVGLCRVVSCGIVLQSCIPSCTKTVHVLLTAGRIVINAIRVEFESLWICIDSYRHRTIRCQGNLQGGAVIPLNVPKAVNVSDSTVFLLTAVTESFLLRRFFVVSIFL